MRRGGPRNISTAEGTMPKGKISIGALGEEYIIKLDKLAHKWGCLTLSDAELELLKDAIDEELKR